MLRTIIFSFCLLAAFLTQGQALTSVPQGYFVQDSAKIGAHLQYVLLHRHPLTQEVIFPDTSYNFFPFELIEKKFFPTQSDSVSSTDSTVYILRTFETDKIQKLALPVYILRNRDTLKIFTNPDSVILHEMVTEIPEPLVLKQNTELVKVQERFNYPYLLAGLAAVILVLGLIWLIFGRALKTRYRLYKLRKDYRTFISRFQAHTIRFSRSGTINNLERAVSDWKNYLTRLEKQPVNSFTTKELVTFYDNNEEVNTSLRQCDRAIYGNISDLQPEEMQPVLEQLKSFATARYSSVSEKLRHV